MPNPNHIPQCPGIPNSFSNGREERAFKISLITPMFGGGVEAGVPDKSFPIRPTAVRGQLQFWWRATTGAKYGTKEDLRSAQSDIWGSTEQASRVRIRIQIETVGAAQPCAKFNWNPQARDGKRVWRIKWDQLLGGHGSALPYALFPFQGETPPPQQDAAIEKPPSTCIRSPSFRLQVDCPSDLWQGIEPAIWAWANFGGLGARTRRGCGAVFCKDLAPTNADDLATKWKEYLPTVFPVRQWPTLGESILTGTAMQSVSAWNKVIGLMQRLRQGEGIGRNPGTGNSPGRSRWPEPETIRKITGNRAGKRTRQPSIPDDAFPRAELGLPIVFHFKDNRNGDPPGNGRDPDCTLYPGNGSGNEQRDRMASPLILKPVALADGNAIPVILQLKTEQLSSVDLRQENISSTFPTSIAIRGSRLATYPDTPLAASTAGSAIEAFLELAKTNGFTEVTP